MSDEKLKKRIKSLAKEKSRLQLVSDIMTELAGVNGLENIIRHSISTIMDAWGGSNVLIYFRNNNIWYLSDINNESKELAVIEDLSVQNTIMQKKSRRITDRHDYNNETMNWLYPLIVKDDLIGVLKIEGVSLYHSETVFNDFLLITNYLSLVLRNELINTSNLMQANEELKKQQLILQREIIERKKSEEYLKSIFNAAQNIAFIITDLNGVDTKILDISPGGEKIFQCTKDDVLGKPVSIFHTEDISGTFPEIQEELVRNGCTETLEMTLIRRTGEHFPGLMTLYPRYDVDGNIFGTIGITIDITERKNNEERYKKTIESSFDGFWISDMKGRFLEVNEAYCNIIGYSKDELLNMSIPDIEVLESEEDTREHIRENIKTGSLQFETKHKNKNGSILDIEVSSTYSEYLNGVFYVFLRDITEKKLLEEQFYQSQKVESIGRLAGGIAHDLNNLLLPILGYSELLIGGFAEDDKRKVQAGQILNASLKARDLVHQLLAYSRKQTLIYHQYNLSKILIDFEGLLRSTIRKNIIIRIDTNEKLPDILADKGQIEQVIMNLAVNAQYAMASGGELTLEVSYIEIDKGLSSRHEGIPAGNYSLLSVRDTGCGFSDSIRKKIFEPFFSTKGEHGTGLGLSTVYGIIRQHEGFIQVESIENTGTEFRIYLPAVKPCSQ